MNLKYLICGTGRCGTVYMARVLTSLGISCGHESIFNYRGLENACDIIRGKKLPEVSHCSTYDVRNGKPIEKWVEEKDIIAESSYLAAPYLDHNTIKDVPLIHIVRDPLKVITSWVSTKTLENDKNSWGRFIYAHLPQLYEIQNPVDKACFYFVKWNEMIERFYKDRKVLFYRVEDDLEDVIDFLNIKNFKGNVFSDRRVNSWKSYESLISLKQIENKGLALQIKQMCRRYKYIIKLQ